jgi:DNA-binding response OmpR family regulator
MTQKSELRGLRILIVDDALDLADELAETLCQWWYEVVGPASNVSDALMLIRDETIQGALLDANLGHEKVFPVAADLRARNIPFLFINGYSMVEFPPEFEAAPRIAKPFDAAMLAAAMVEIFAAGR